ncbi:NlpC/P60 family protein [Paraburkholderia sacchari]|uniref:NlpC/P60 family protein n=1 Tax=Paraburkholderia sacchari TaxID=159450 RepID=UPI001BCC603D|nr:NlpC/P60 family protein [Paraburkholderia sacchari]
MVTRAQIVEEARTWLGTPYRHQGRLKGVACDCAGLVIGVARALSLKAEDVEGYTRRADGSLAGHCDARMERIAPEHAQAGDVVLFHWNNSPVHLAILTGPDSIIHAFAINRFVCEHRIDEKWRRQIVRYYSIPGVE